MATKTTQIDITPFVKLTGSQGAAEVLLHVYTCCPDGTFKPKSPKALHHLIRLGYLKPDFGRGVVNVLHDKISQDLATIGEA